MARTEPPSGPDPSSSGASYRTFVITLWLEPSERAAEPEWRWRVTDPTGREPRYFRRLPDLLAFVSEQAEAPPPC